MLIVIRNSHKLAVMSTQPRELTRAEKSRYERQISIPDFGEDGQKLLRTKSALVTRVGGLGGAAAIGLAMAGIGKLIIAHGSVLIEPDLNRQLLFGEHALGKPRASEALERLRSLSKFTEVIAIDHEPNDAEALELAKQVNIVLCCPPGWPERFRLNRACIKAGIPMIDAAMNGMEGTLTTILPGETACLACRISETPAPPFDEFFPVLGSVSHVMGSLAATEALKVLSGFSQPLFNRILCADLSTMQFRMHRLQKDPNCPVCNSVLPKNKHKSL
jgi:molybdopterin-synthase adenylyltransferase